MNSHLFSHTFKIMNGASTLGKYLIELKQQQVFIKRLDMKAFIKVKLKYIKKMLAFKSKLLYNNYKEGT